MKKWGAFLIAAVLLIGVGVAVAVGGSSTDPLISLSYIEDTYLPGVAERLQSRAAEKTKEAYSAAVSRLDALGEADVAQAEGTQAGNGTYTPAQLKRGDSLELKPGGSVLLYEGSARVVSGVLADVTAGMKIVENGGLTTGHRYIATSSAPVSVQMTTAGKLGYQGEGKVTAGTDDGLPFQDVIPGNWFYDAVKFVYDRGYFSGVAEDRFAPNTPMNRAMLATVLHRFSGGSERGEAGQFSDIPENTWYTDGVNWASSYGVVKGMGNGTYRPTTPVTREQMVTMLYRYLVDYKKVETTQTDEMPGFPDWEQVSDWARESLTWAIENGLIKGRNTGLLDPKGNATRAEVATVLQRFAGLLETN